MSNEKYKSLKKYFTVFDTSWKNSPGLSTLLATVTVTKSAKLYPCFAISATWVADKQPWVKSKDALLYTTKNIELD